jgi:prostaglandin-E synthase 1
MNSLVENPTFFIFAVSAIILSVNLLALWAYSGIARGKRPINEEDAIAFKVPLQGAEPSEVARVLRAHRNAEASIYPFIVIALLFVFAGGAPGFAKIVFGIFVAARLLHSLVYLAGKQPWRTIFFIVGNIATVALLINLIMLLVHAPT